MAFSGGVFSLVSGNPVTTATTISSTWANNTLNDIATNGLSVCLLKDGSQTVTANIPMSTFKFTGLGAGTAATDSCSITNLQNHTGIFLTSVAGTNTITATSTPTPAYTVGQMFTFIPANTNTGAVTLNISSLGAGAVQAGGGALVGGELVANIPVTVYVSAATPVFEIIHAPLAGTSASTFTFDGSGGSSGSITMTYQMVGKMVYLNIPVTLATTGTSSTKLVANTALPSAIRPTLAHQSITQIYQNNSPLQQVGLLDVSSGGIVSIFKAPNTTDNYTNTTANTGIGESITVVYFTG